MPLTVDRDGDLNGYSPSEIKAAYVSLPKAVYDALINIVIIANHRTADLPLTAALKEWKEEVRKAAI